MTGPPYKCPECGVWWAGLEHRCQPNIFRTTTNQPPATFTVTCNCQYDPEGHRIQRTLPCPVHDVQTTYTAGNTTTSADHD